MGCAICNKLYNKKGKGNKRRVVKDAIKKIAKREGKSEIREEMKKAILCGFLNNETRCKWDRLFGVERLPDPEEFIMKMAEVMA